VEAAAASLAGLGAVEVGAGGVPVLTPLGVALARLPLDVRLGRLRRGPSVIISPHYRSCGESL
jgi:HrpA-like RNA helicase